MTIFDRLNPFHKVKNEQNQKADDIRNKIPFEQALYRHKQDIARWSNAVKEAESIQFPNRTELLRVFKETTIDNHLTALMDTRKNPILGSKFIVVDKGGKEDQKKTDLLDRQWFYDFLNLSLDSIFWGFSLIQFGDMVNGEFSTVELVDRQYVRQEKDIVIPTTGAQIGTNFLEAPYNNWCIGVGKKRDLGLLMKAAPTALFKKQSMGAWTQYTELFGQPIRVGKVRKYDPKTHAEFKKFLQEMGNTPYVIMDKDDELELIDGNKASGQDLYDKLIDRCNSELSKLILGQTGTTDEKAHVGSSNVHERIMHLYNESDLRFIKFVLNNQLLPLLSSHGYGFDGWRIDVEEDNELSLVEKSKIDLELLKYYQIPEDYILKTYGTPTVNGSYTPPKGKGNTINKLDDYYNID